MKPQGYKIAICIVFLTIFFVKMVISVAPAFVNFGKDKHSNTVRAVIMQLEQENKDDRYDAAKDLATEKNFSVENFLLVPGFEYNLAFIAAKSLHNQEHAHPLQVYHPTVPTPPPNSLS